MEHIKREGINPRQTYEGSKNLILDIIERLMQLNADDRIITSFHLEMDVLETTNEEEIKYPRSFTEIPSRSLQEAINGMMEYYASKDDHIISIADLMDIIRQIKEYTKFVFPEATAEVNNIVDHTSMNRFMRTIQSPYRIWRHYRNFGKYVIKEGGSSNNEES